MFLEECTGVRRNVLHKKEKVSLFIRQQLNKKHEGNLAVKIRTFENGRVLMNLNITNEFFAYIYEGVLIRP
jgi:hypothetical protein